jgi:hypothetical protein
MNPFAAEFEVDLKWRAGDCRLVATGVLAEHTAPLLEAVLDHAEQAGVGHVTVDLTGTRFAGPNQLAPLLRLRGDLDREATAAPPATEPDSPALRRLVRRLDRPSVTVAGSRYAFPVAA